jgi:transaldolase
MPTLSNLKIQIFADGADKARLLDLYARPYIKGLTTNPTLMNKAGIKDYEGFARDILQTVTAKPISLEVFSDDFPEMKRQALKIAGCELNVTALLTLEQVKAVAGALDPDVPSVVSLFAGRIADTGVDPIPLMRASRNLLKGQPLAQLLWASVREPLNIIHAEQAGCDIVTVTADILDKASKMFGMDLEALSLETVRMFARDALEAGYRL